MRVRRNGLAAGADALEYARSRKSTSDFERAARQQRILLSLRQQMDIGSILKNINPLAEAIGQSVRTDIPRELVPQLLKLAMKVRAGARFAITQVGWDARAVGELRELEQLLGATSAFGA